MKFQDKCASLRQLNSPNSKEKFKYVVSTCILISRDFEDFPEFLGSGTTLNLIQTGDQKFASGDYISTVGHQKATWVFFSISSPVEEGKFTFNM